MEWRDLRPEVKSTLELCWGLYDDNPRSITREIGKEFTVYLGVSHIPHSVTRLFTEDSYQQILEYQKSDTSFDVRREGNVVTFTGRGRMGVGCEIKHTGPEFKTSCKKCGLVLDTESPSIKTEEAFREHLLKAGWVYDDGWVCWQCKEGNNG